jgi:hypothetical protein
MVQNLDEKESLSSAPPPLSVSEREEKILPLKLALGIHCGF